MQTVQTMGDEMEANETNTGWYPDGLTPDVIDALLSEMETHWSTQVRPSGLADGAAVERRERRTARRAIGAVVRALPMRPQHADPAGEVA
jgi:hypothetical protein